MSSSWSNRRVGDFATRKKIINEAGEDLPPLSVTKDRGVILQSEKYNKRVATDPHKYVVVEDGDFAFDPMSLYYGALGRVGGVERGLISPDYVSFTVDTTVDPTFLEYKLRSAEMVRVYERVAQAGNQFGKRRRVYWSVLSELPVFLPPLPEQREIAAALKAVDEGVAACVRVADQLEVVRDSALHSLLGEHGARGGPAGAWSSAPLGSVATFVNGRAFKPSDWKDSGIPIVRIQNLNGSGAFNYYQGGFEPRYELKPGDLLFSWSGTRGTSFGPHVWRGPSAVLNQHIFNVRDARGVTKEFLFYALKLVTSEVEKRAHGGTGIVHITKGALEQFKIPVPPLADQVRIATVLSTLDNAARAQREHLAGARRLRGALADALLSGRTRLQRAA